MRYALYCFCSQLVFVNWLQKHLLPCPFKYLTGIDCPGCGFQRSIIMLLQGNLKQSLHFYPAAIPLMILMLIHFLDSQYHFDKKGWIKTPLAIITGSIIAVSYVLKMTH